MMDIKKYNLMIVVIIIASGITIGAEGFLDAAGSGGWLLAVFYTFIGAVVYPFLFNTEAIGEFYKKSHLLKKFTTVVIALGGVFYAAALTASIADNITTAFMNHTPVQYMLILLILPGAVGCWFGTRSVARYALPVAVGGIAVILLLFVMCLGEYRIDNLYPLLGRGLRGAIRGFPAMGIFSPVIFYFAVMSEGTGKSIRANVAKIILFSGLAVSAVCLGINLLMPYPGAEATSMPLYTLGASVRGNYLIERSESVVLILWLFCAYVTVGGITAVISDMCATVFSLDNRNALTGAFCGCVFAVELTLCGLDIADRAFFISCSILGVLSFVLPVAVNIRHRLLR